MAGKEEAGVMMQVSDVDDGDESKVWIMVHVTIDEVVGGLKGAGDDF